MLSFHEEQEVLPETFLANFPSLIKMDIHKKVTDPSVAKSMMACLLSSLKANGEYLFIELLVFELGGDRTICKDKKKEVHYSEFTFSSSPLWFDFWIISCARIACILIIEKCCLFYTIDAYFEPQLNNKRTWGYIYFARRLINDSWKLNFREKFHLGMQNCQFFWVYVKTFKNTLFYIGGMKTICEEPDSKYSRL